MNLIGIMQGRLSKPLPDRLQGFPSENWSREFDLALQVGFDGIEWVFQAEDAEGNPIRRESGRSQIRECMRRTGIQMPSICADYFMAHPFFGVSPREQAESVTVLLDLIGQARSVGASMVLIPVLESAEIRTDSDRAELKACLREPLALARSVEVRLGLETELPAPEYLRLVEEIGHESVAVYYDVGNAAAKGYDVAADVRYLGKYLHGVHVKDRILGGQSVPLGQGQVDFDRFFEALADIHYSGTFVLQTAFGNNYLDDAKKNLAYIRRYLPHEGQSSQVASQQT